MGRGWDAAKLTEIERLPLSDDGVEWTPVRAHFGIEAFGVNAWSGDAGSEVIGPHDETDEFAGGHEELYLVVRGRASFAIGDDEVDAAAGTLVFVGAPALRRGAVAREDGTTVLTIGGRRGEAFTVAAWEYLVRAAARGRVQDWRGAIEQTRRGLEHHPASAELLYHQACYESLAGRLAEARRDLDRAIARDARLRERARRDPDLEPLRL